jgi:hypothetical protein
MELLDKLKAKVQQYVPDLLGDGSDVEVELPAITEILGRIDSLFDDGFQWTDVPKLIGILVPELMELAGKQEGKSGDEKRQFVVDAGTCVYFYYNPDIKYVPEWLETRAEKLFVPKLIECAVEAAYTIHRKIFDKIAAADDAGE